MGRLPLRRSASVAGRAERADEHDDEDAHPGQERGGDQPEVTDAQRVTQAHAERLPGVRPEDRRRNEEEQLAAGRAAYEHVEGDVENARRYRAELKIQNP